MQPDVEIERQAMELVEAALERPKAERRAWIEAQCADSADLSDVALQLYNALDSSDVQFRTGGANEASELLQLPERVGAYRSVELLGEGGMGAVFLARRDTGDFDHEVAIKIIKPELLTEELVARFERERQILASLTHPNIARLYDGGTTEDGEPFIVMEYIDGVPITKWCDEQDLGRNERLGLMAEICDAVGAAHQNLIVHRDLTPNNVLVTPAGVPKLIDFGIAKPQETSGSGSGFTEKVGSMSLTPGFAAPERYTGAPATTLTDIYSLGKLLDRIAADDRSDPDIAAIVEKATAEEPKDRYPTARAMARDIERFVRNYPVEARSSGKRYAARKFIIRNRGPVIAAAATIILLLGAFGATIYAYAQAEQQRALAQRSFAETRTIARTMMFDVYDEVSRVPGSVRARLLLADTAQRYLESLASNDGADANIRFEAAQGYFRLAEVVGARTGGGTVGQTARAKEFYERSRDLLETLHEELPERRDVRARLGQVLAVMADSALLSDGNFETAETYANRARALLEPLPDPDAASAGALILTYLHEGNALAFEGEPEPAGETYRAGLEAVRRLPESLRTTAEVRRAEAEIYRMMGAYHAYFQRPDEARQVLERSLGIHRAVVAQTDFEPRDIYGLVTILQAVAQMEFSSGNVDRADRLATEAVRRARQGMESSPNDVGPQELFTVVAIFKAHMLASRGRYGEAVALADDAIALKRQLIERSGNVVSGPMTLAVRLQEASEVYLLARRRDRACPIMREAVAIMREYEETADLPIANRTNNLEPMLAALRDC